MEKRLSQFIWLLVGLGWLLALCYTPLIFAPYEQLDNTVFASIIQLANVPLSTFILLGTGTGYDNTILFGLATFDYAKFTIPLFFLGFLYWHKKALSWKIAIKAAIFSFGLAFIVGTIIGKIYAHAYIFSKIGSITVQN